MFCNQSKVFNILHHTDGYMSDLFFHDKALEIPVLTQLSKLNDIFISFFGHFLICLNTKCYTKSKHSC